MKAKGDNQEIMLVMATSLLVAFFVGSKAYASVDLIIEYFNKTFWPQSNETTASDIVSDGNFGIISWLPGKEFEILLNHEQPAATMTIPTNTTPQHIIDNLYKRIVLVQEPTAEELKQEILATVVEHNLPIAVLNVWRPHTTIKIKNLTNYAWQQAEVVLTSSNFEGGLSFFRDPSWESAMVITTMQEQEVAPGETASFEFLIDGRGRPHVYDHVYRMLINKQPIHLDAKGGFYWLTRVDPYNP